MTHPPLPPLHWTRRLAYLSFAALFFSLAVLGMFLPIIPATPFLLITSYFLVRSFPKLNELLLRAPYFGPILYDWEVRKGIRTKVKLQAIATVILGWAFSVLVFPIPPWALIIMGVLVLIGIAYIYRVPQPRDPAEIASEEWERLEAAHKAKDSDDS